MSTFLSSITPNSVMSPFPDRTRTINPILRRAHCMCLSHQSVCPPGALGVARFGFMQPPFPDPDIAECLFRYLFARAEGFLFTIADAAVSSPSDPVTSTKQNSDWLSGITYCMETVLKVLKDGLSSLHAPYACGLAIILLTVLIRAATFPLTKKQGQVESVMDGDAIPATPNKCYSATVYWRPGCLPTLATIPVWIGLYRALSNVADEVTS